MNFLITGATGYLGQRLTKLLISHNHEITTASRKAYNSDNAWIFYDIESNREINIPENIDVVFHLAAHTSRKNLNQHLEIDSAKMLVAATKKANAIFIFVSSQTAHKYAPTSYGQTKWKIEQEVLSANGLIVRLGQVYGGPELGLFGTLTRLVRNLPLLPAFLPPPEIQPIHVDDCALGLLSLAKTNNTGSVIYNLASPESITFTKFLLAISKHRIHKYRLFIPIPTSIVKVINIAIGENYSKKTGLNRLTSLFNLPVMNTEKDLDTLGLKLRPLHSGMHKSGNDVRRKLIREGMSILEYLLNEKPRLNIILRYVKVIESLRKSESLEIPAWILRTPIFLALIESRKDITTLKADELKWRLNAATIIAEASPQGARRFLGNRESTHKIVSLYQLTKSIIIHILWILIRKLLPISFFITHNKKDSL